MPAAPAKLAALVDVLPALSEAALFAALTQSPTARDELHGCGVAEVEPVLQAAAFLCKQAAQGGVTPEKLAKSLTPLGFSAGHIDSLYKAISTERSDGDQDDDAGGDADNDDNNADDDHQSSNNTYFDESAFEALATEVVEVVAHLDSSDSDDFIDDQVEVATEEPPSDAAMMVSPSSFGAISGFAQLEICWDAMDCCGGMLQTSLSGALLRLLSGMIYWG